MAPPELARNAPGLDVFQPGEIGVLVLLGHELGAAFAHGGERGLGQHIGLDPPLVGQEGLDDDELGLLVMRHHDLLVLDVIEAAGGVFFGQRRQVGDDALARVETVEAAIGLGRLVERWRRGW